MKRIAAGTVYRLLAVAALAGSVCTQTVAIGSGLALFTLVSVFRSGRNGWGWVLWLTVFGALGWLLHLLCGRRSHRGHAGGHYGEGFSGGGGLGGGFSGGGGATGSW